MTWSQAAAHLEDFNFARDIKFAAVIIDGVPYSITAYHLGDEIIYCRACERDPTSFCLLSSDRSELENG